MGGKKEVGPSPQEAVHQQVLLEDHSEFEKQLKEFLLPGEVVVYRTHDVFLTNKRLIKHRVDWYARAFHFVYSSFEDLDLRFIESIKAKNVINLRLFMLGLLVILLGPVAMFFALIPGAEGVGLFLVSVFVDGLGLGGLLLIGLVLVVSSLLLRDRIVEFWGHGVVVRTRHFHDVDLVKVREAQHLRLMRLGLDK